MNSSTWPMIYRSQRTWRKRCRRRSKSFALATISTRSKQSSPRRSPSRRISSRQRSGVRKTVKPSLGNQRPFSVVAVGDNAKRCRFERNTCERSSFLRFYRLAPLPPTGSRPMCRSRRAGPKTFLPIKFGPSIRARRWCARTG